MSWVAVAIGGSAVLGAVMGSQRQGGGSTQYIRNPGIAGDLENQAGTTAGNAMDNYGSMVNAGPGQQDVTAGTDATRSFAQLLQQFGNGGYMPTQQDYGYAQGMTNSVFAPQQTQLQQSFVDQGVQANRAAARMGRAGNDPVLLAKLAQEQTRQQSSLDAQKTSYFSQTANQMPQMRLNYAQQYATVSQGLASQALANRQALFSMGSQLRGQEQNFRTGNASTAQNNSGTAGNPLAGALAGAGMGANMYSASNRPSSAPPSTYQPSYYGGSGSAGYQGPSNSAGYGEGSATAGYGTAQSGVMNGQTLG